VTPPPPNSKNQKNLVGGSIHSNAASLASVTPPPRLATPTPIALGSSPHLALGGGGGASRSGGGAYASQTLIDGGKALATHVPTPATPAAGASAATPATPASPALPPSAPPDYGATCMLRGSQFACCPRTKGQILTQKKTLVGCRDDDQRSGDLKLLVYEALSY
jgi:hypothetical protein